MLKAEKGILGLMDHERLDIISDVMALTSYGNVKNVILVAAEAVGTFDEDAFALAVRRASAKVPVLTSRLKEVRDKGQYFLVREHSQELHLPVFVSELSKSNHEEPTFDSLITHMIPRLDRDWNLFLEPPVEINVLALGENHFVSVLLMHHSAGDAEAILALLKVVLGEYDALVSGQASRWLENPYASSTSKKKESAERRFGWKDFLGQLWRNLPYREVKPVLPCGTGDRKETREWHVKRVLSDQDSARILKCFSHDSLHVIDHLVACTNLALDEWNRKYNLKPGTITSAVTVNMRGRFGGQNEKNYSSVISLQSNPDDRRDYLKFVNGIASWRIKQFEKGADLTTRKSFLLGSKLFYYLPFGLRRGVPSFFMKRQQYSAAVTFMGTLFPRLDGEGMDRESSLTKFGNLEIIEIHGAVYKHVGGAAMHLVAFVYRNRLNLLLGTWGKFMTEAECNGFMDALVHEINRTTQLWTEVITQA